MSKNEYQNLQVRLTGKERVLLGGIESRHDDMVKTLITWSHINSGSHNSEGLHNMREHLRAYMDALPGTISDAGLTQGEYVDAQGTRQSISYEPAVLLRVRPKAERQLVLTGHYDTVFPKDSHFQTTILLDPDTMNGPGVADMKGGILVMLNALMTFEKSENAQNVGYVVLLSPDEEIGSPGSDALLREFGSAAHVGLTYEPSLPDGSLAGARKGSGNFALIIKGRAAHAGREHHLGRNAINAMAEFAVGLDGLNGQRNGVTFNMAKIDGGGASNIVPDLAVGRFNVRMLEESDMSWIESRLEVLINRVNQKEGISAELTGGFSRPPKPMSEANQMVFNWVKMAGNALGQDIKWNPSGGVCEGNNLWASGCPNVDSLGVHGGDIHSDREFIKLPSLVERTQLSALILLKIASGEFDVSQAKDLAVKGTKGGAIC